MPCYHPLLAWQCANGDVVFAERRNYDIVRELQLPCNQCIGCRLERSRKWAMRCMHEASLYEGNSFVTLTYDDVHLPVRGQLDYPEFQRFMKRLRKKFGADVRFYMCGEYGEKDWRPHYHACLFNTTFEDKLYLCTLPSGAKLYRSATLERLWPYGISSVGDVTFESAAYVARYCVQKVTGHNAKAHYARVHSVSHGAPYHFQLVPEFNQMSRRPGIGKPWLEKYKADVFPHDYIVINGTKCGVPRYYDKMYAASDPDTFEYLQFERELDGRRRYEDNTPERLLVKETVAEARLSLLKRGMLNGDS